MANLEMCKLCPYKVTFDWVGLEKTDRDMVMQFMNFLRKGQKNGCYEENATTMEKGGPTHARAE